MVIALCFGFAGLGLIIAHFVLSRQRLYLFYLGVGFLILAGSCFLPDGILRNTVMCVAAAVILLATYEAYLETKDRMRRFHDEQKIREEAFGDYLEAMERRRQELARQSDDEHR